MEIFLLQILLIELIDKYHEKYSTAVVTAAVNESLKPVQIVSHDFSEYLLEDMWALDRLEIEELAQENQLRTDCVNEGMILRTEHLF